LEISILSFQFIARIAEEKFLVMKHKEVEQENVLICVKQEGCWVMMVKVVALEV